MLQADAGLRLWRSAAIGIEYPGAPGLLIFLLLNQTLILGCALDRCPVQAVGGELQKRSDGWGTSGGNELEAFQ